MKKFYYILGICFLIFIGGCAEEGSGPKKARVSSVSLIQEDVAKGKLDKETGLVYQVYALFDQERLPAEYRSEVIIPSGSSIMVEVRRNWDSLSKETKEKLEPFFVDSQDPRYFRQQQKKGSWLGPRLAYARNLSFLDTANGKVRIWYDRNDEGERQQVSWILDTFNEDRAWEKEVALMGREVKSDNGAVGNDGKLDIYLEPLNCMGMAVPGPVSNKKTYAKLIINKGQNKKETQNSVVHELFHALQYNININIGSWWKESTATWCEDYIYPDYDIEHHYLPWYFNHLEKGLKFKNGHLEYGAYVWPLFLQQNYGAQIIGKIWQDCEHKSLEEAWLANLGGQVGFEKAFKKYSLWLYNQLPVQEFRDGNKPGKHLSVVPEIMDAYTALGIDIVDLKHINPLGITIVRFLILDKDKGRSIYFRFPIHIEYYNMLLWSIVKIKDKEEVVEDLQGVSEKSYCFDLKEEDLEEIVFIFANPSFDRSFVAVDVLYGLYPYGCEAKLDLDITLTKEGDGQWKHPVASMWLNAQQKEKINLSVLFTDPKKKEKTKSLNKLVPTGGFSYSLQGESEGGQSVVGVALKGSTQLSGYVVDRWEGDSLESKETKSTITLSVEAGQEEQAQDMDKMPENVPAGMEEEFKKLQNQLESLQQLTTQGFNQAKSLGMKVPGKDELKYKINLYLNEMPYTLTTILGDNKETEKMTKSVGPVEIEDVVKKDKKVIINKQGRWRGASLKINGVLKLKKDD